MTQNDTLDTDADDGGQGNETPKPRRKRSRRRRPNTERPKTDGEANDKDDAKPDTDERDAA